MCSVISWPWDVPTTRPLQKKFCFFFLTCLILSNPCDPALLQQGGHTERALHDKEPKGEARWVREKEKTSRAFVKHTAQRLGGCHLHTSENEDYGPMMKIICI